MSGAWRDPARDIAAGEARARDGSVLRRGSRVRIVPHPGGEMLDLALGGRLARVERIDHDDLGRCVVALVLEDDPGRDLGGERFLAHRFFFDANEVELAEAGPTRRLLVAGIGNVFFGDDGFGVEVVRALAGRELPPAIEVADFGIRGHDLAYALQGGHDGAILVDALPLDDEPGTLSVLCPEVAAFGPAALDSHALDPVRVLAFARELGPLPAEIVVVGCAVRAPAGGDDEMVMELGSAVRAAVEPAVELVRRLAQGFLEHGRFPVEELARDGSRPQGGRSTT